MTFRHTPVLLDECINGLAIRADGTYADGTLGGGGHAGEILRRLSPDGLLIGIDRDEEAAAAAAQHLAGIGGNYRIVHGNYRDMPSIVRQLGVEKLDGILLDLGISSHQIDTAERGFSYMQDAPLDMRMDRSETRTAADLVNEETEEELTRILREYGEERCAASIARHIVAARQTQPVATTGDLVRIICEAVPKKAQLTGGHPAKRTFQAIRIALNGELAALEGSLEDLIGLLNEGGRICVITFHSLEDRIVKNVFRRSESPCICPPEFPVCVCGRVSLGKVVTRKPILPSAEEMEANPRAKSAKLRIFERRTPGETKVLRR